MSWSEQLPEKPINQLGHTLYADHNTDSKFLLIRVKHQAHVLPLHCIYAAHAIVQWLYTVPPSLSDLQGHGSRDNIPWSQVLGRGSISLHEPLSILVDQVASLASVGCKVLLHNNVLRVYTCQEAEIEIEHMKIDKY